MAGVARLALLTGVAAGALAGAPAPVAAQLLDYFIDRAIGEGHLPACDHPFVVQEIQSRLATADHKIFKSGVALLGIIEPRQTLFTQDDPSPTPRRYCKGYADLTNGAHPPLFYRIEARHGFASYTWRVDFCMPGYDPWRVHGGWCDTIRPGVR